MDIPEKMQAAVLVGPNELRLKEVPVPEPGPGEALLRVEACAICGTDLKLIDHPWPGQPPYGEYVPGHEYAGTVVALGETVDEFQVGDRVAIEAHKGCGRCPNCIKGFYTACLNYGRHEKGHRTYGFTTNGGYAQYAVNHINTLYKLSDNVSFPEATLVTTAGCSLYGLESVGGFFPGDTVVVLGPGPIGLMAVQLAKALGAATVILTGTRESRLKLGAELGADITLKAVSNEVKGRVMEATRGVGADLVVDCSGDSSQPQAAIEMVKKGGKVLLISYYKDWPSLDLSTAVRNNLSLVGIRGEGALNCGRALSLIAAGKVKASPLISHRLPLREVERGIRIFRERLEDAMKVVLLPHVD